MDLSLDLIAYAGQIIIGAYFALASISDMIDRTLLKGLLKRKHVPFAGFLLYCAIALKLFGGLALIFNIFTVIASILLSIFLIIANCIFHNFWSFKGGDFKREYMAFLTHITIIGGLLLVVGR